MKILATLESKFIKIFKIGDFPLFQEAHNAINFVIYHEVRNRNYILNTPSPLASSRYFRPYLAMELFPTWLTCFNQTPRQTMVAFNYIIIRYIILGCQYSNYEQSKFYFFWISWYDRLKIRFPSISITSKFMRLLDLFTSVINPSIPLNNPSTITILSFTSNWTFTTGITLPYFKGELFQNHRLHSPNSTLSPFLVSMASIPSAALSSAEQDTGSKYLFMGQHRPS